MLKPDEILDEYYLEVRCKLLEIAAILDRYDRSVAAAGESSSASDKRLEQCRKAVGILAAASVAPDRAERTALVFTEMPDE